MRIAAREIFDATPADTADLARIVNRAPYDRIAHPIDTAGGHRRLDRQCLCGDSRATTGHVLAHPSSGGVCINHVILQLGDPRLPFGGVGDSGIGA